MGDRTVRLDERFDVSPGKVQELKDKIARLGIDLGLVEETFARGGGKGGQKINKTANCVLLRYPPLRLSVRCQRERRRTVNRFLALRELVEQAELLLSPGTSVRLAARQDERRRKARRGAKARKKYGKGSASQIDGGQRDLPRGKADDDRVACRHADPA